MACFFLLFYIGPESFIFNIRQLDIGILNFIMGADSYHTGERGVARTEDFPKVNKQSNSSTVSKSLVQQSL